MFPKETNLLLDSEKDNSFEDKINGYLTLVEKSKIEFEDDNFAEGYFNRGILMK